MAVDQTHQLKESNGDNISPVLSEGNVTGANLNTSAFPDTCFFPKIVAEGGNNMMSLSNNTFVNMALHQSLTTIYDSNYASSRSSDILLQPGCYYVVARARFLDAGYNGHHGFFGIRLSDEAADDNIEKGNWQFSNNRLSIEAKRVFKLTAAKGVQLQVYCEVVGGISASHLWIYKLPDW